MPEFTTAVSCFLCKAQVPYKSEDKSKLLAHLKKEHGAMQGMDYLVAGCTMSKEERIAIQNVVGGRQPKLIQLQMDETDEEMDEQEVVDEDGELGGVTTKLLEPETTLSESPARSTTKTPPREKKCQDCGFTCRLQIQMNRHKNLCVKKEFSSSTKASPGSKWKLKVKERKKSDEGIPPKSRRSFQEDGSGKKPKKSPYVSPGKGVPCRECNKEFRNQAVLDRHFEDLHQPGEFPCPGDERICGKVFTSRNKMSSHYSRNCNPNNPAGAQAIARRRASLGLE